MTNPNPAATPDPNGWRDRFAMVSGAAIAYEHGAVQFVGTRQLAISEDVVAVPFSVLFQLVGEVLAMLDSKHPMHRAARAVLFAPPGVLPNDLVVDTAQLKIPGT